VIYQILQKLEKLQETMMIGKIEFNTQKHKCVVSITTAHGHILKKILCIHVYE